jgi:hypothetical protein
VTAEDFREIALGMQGAVERSHMGHPDFRAAGRIFSTLQADDKWGTVKLAPDEQRELMRTHPHVFMPASGAWGQQGWTKVLLESADASTIRSAMLLAWQHVVEAPRRRPTSASARSRSTRPTRKRQI